MTRTLRLIGGDGPRPGRPALADLDDERWALFDLGGHVVAVDDACLRCGGSIAAAPPEGPIALCGGCGWRYDLAAGVVEGLPALRIAVLDVRILHGEWVVARSALAQRPPRVAPRGRAR